MDAEGHTKLIPQPGDAIGGLPRDVRRLIGSWLGPCPLIRVRARSACQFWWRDDWVPCDLDLFRNAENGKEGWVMPVRWSSVETVVHLVLNEPDEVCARMDSTFARFLSLPQDRSSPVVRLPFVVLRPAISRGKLAVIDSFLRHSHLEPFSRDWGSVKRKYLEFHAVLPRLVLVHAVVRNRIDVLLHYRYLLWAQHCAFRLRLLWLALFCANQETFHALFHTLGCGSIDILEQGHIRFFIASDYQYLRFSDEAKRSFIAKALSIPTHREADWKYPQLHKLLSFVLRLSAKKNPHDVAAAVDLGFALYGHLEHSARKDCARVHLVHAQTDLQPFSRLSAGYEDDIAGNDENDDDDADSYESRIRSACEAAFPCAPDLDNNVLHKAEHVLEIYGRGCTQKANAARERHILWTRPMRAHWRRLPTHDEDDDEDNDQGEDLGDFVEWDDPEEEQLAKQLVARKRARAALRLGPTPDGFPKRFRAPPVDYQVITGPTRSGVIVIPVPDPYEESMESSEEARILEEEDELEYAEDDEIDQDNGEEEDDDDDE